MKNTDWLDAIKWDEKGLIPAIAQDAHTREILMLAWINREALLETLACGNAVYWSRSRGKLWRKGEESGHVQKIVDIRLDCDNDALVYLVEQTGLACHTGRRSCFFQQLKEDGGEPYWEAVEPVLKNPSEIYR
ncbi:MAG: phosphoribosyl-AMP cyclohydrolase [Oxalobacter sp.]|nr:phosphoribosyl-AMP cyclohydrolase [Oxalobacter sp.]